MEIKTDKKADGVHVVVSGDIEMMTIKNLKDSLLNIANTEDSDIFLDLADVGYIDSSGVGVLISIKKFQDKKGRNFVISEISDKVLGVLKLSSLAGVFDLE